ncbi:MAG: TetR family transcriptional regulator [Sandaracinaceae bacterium]|nr:TetR family transcriptional regulator [Myxococcales bacterium]MCB9656033.1 TetR family transcriptional regulator [Sandaracinaceae bacterium]
MAPRNAPARRSDATKAAILEAAREQFAANGYGGATIRAIAAAAEIDPAMVMRYFGNKEKLFAAAADFDLRFPDFADVPREAVGAAVVEHFLSIWEGDESFVALLRTSVTHDEVADRMRGIFASQVVPAIARLRGEPPAAVALRTGLLTSQMLGLALCRYVLRVPSVAAADRAELIERVGANVQALLFDR